jgi:hypothetical protein
MAAADVHSDCSGFRVERAMGEASSRIRENMTPVDGRRSPNAISGIIPQRSSHGEPSELPQ